MGEEDVSSTPVGPDGAQPGSATVATDDDGARWLDADEQATWRAFMLATRMLFEQFERELQRSSGMPFQYYEVLVRLSEAPGHEMRMSELADLSQSSRSRLSHAVARLEEAGWVCRRTCASDRRGAMAVLTDEGMDVLRTAAPGHVESVRTHLFDQLSRDQLSQLRRISEDLLRHMAAIGLSCSGHSVCDGAPPGGPVHADDPPACE
jgi:DNA-binding MarR family transcriptional regulator